MWAKFQAFPIKYNITTHSAAALFVILVAAYGAVPQFHTLVQNIFNVLPSWLDQAIVAVVAVYGWYHNGEK